MGNVPTANKVLSDGFSKNTADYHFDKLIKYHQVNNDTCTLQI